MVIYMHDHLNILNGRKAIILWRKKKENTYRGNFNFENYFKLRMLSINFIDIIFKSCFVYAFIFKQWLFHISSFKYY